MSWNSFCNGFKKAVGTAADKINQTTDLATLQVKLGVAERKLEAAYAQLGRDAYRQFTTEEDVVAAVEKSMKRVAAAQKVVDSLNVRIEECKNPDGGKKADTADTDPTDSSAK